MPAPITPGQLAPAHLEALRLSANGFTSAEIARRVGATKAAVDVRLTNASRCLGTRSRVHAVAVAFRLGLLSADDIRLPGGSVSTQQAQEGPQAPVSGPRSLSASRASHEPESASETHSHATRDTNPTNTPRTDAR